MPADLRGDPMPLFGKKKTVEPTPATTVNVGTAKGRISLKKDQAISLVKTPLITATISWPDKTDYDVYALVLYSDGRVETVSQFGTKDDKKFTTRTGDGAVVHLGDVKRGSGALANESIQIRLNSEILAVVPVVYSAQSNGTGSFRRYQVTMAVDNGAGDAVVIDATDASNNDSVYTCVPGIIVNGDTVTVKRLEQYSKPSSERRPTVDRNLAVHMDTGPVNAYK
jgi:stress response protein SCP2